MFTDTKTGHDGMSKVEACMREGLMIGGRVRLRVGIAACAPTIRLTRARAPSAAAQHWCVTESYHSDSGRMNHNIYDMNMTKCVLLICICSIVFAGI